MTAENEIFEDGILNSGQEAGVDTIPEDEIGLGDPAEITSAVAGSAAEDSVEKESDSSQPEAVPQPVEEELKSPPEIENPSVEEMLNPTFATSSIGSEEGGDSGETSDSISATGSAEGEILGSTCSVLLSVSGMEGEVSLEDPSPKISSNKSV